MRKLQIVFYASCFLLATLIPQASADTVTLKSGEKVEGKIIRDTDAEIAVEVKVSASVTDERVIPKSEVEKIDKPQPDEVAFQGIRNLKPDAANSFAPATYEGMITSLKAFQQLFPDSAHHAEVQAVLDAIEAEKQRVDSGEVKFRGNWLSAEQAAQLKPEIQAQQLFGVMKDQGARGDLSGAMNTFERIAASHKGSMIFPDAVDYAKQVLTTLQSTTTRMLGVWAHDQQQLKSSIDFAMPEQKQQLIATAKREQDRDNAALDAAQKAQLKWVPLLPRSQKSLDTLQKQAAAELARLNTLPVKKMRDSIASVDTAKAAIDAKDSAGADKALNDATALWPDNDAAKRYTAIVTAAKAAATPTPTPKVEATPRAGQAPAKAPGEGGGSKKPFFLTIPGAMTIVGIVILIVGGAAILGRGKQSEDEKSK